MQNGKDQRVIIHGDKIVAQGKTPQKMKPKPRIPPHYELQIELDFFSGKVMFSQVPVILSAVIDARYPGGLVYWKVGISGELGKPISNKLFVTQHPYCHILNLTYSKMTKKQHYFVN